MKNEVICSYKEEDSEIEENGVIEYDELIDEENWNDVCKEADCVLGAKDYVRVVGSAKRWNGSSAVDQIIREKTLEDIINEYLNLDRVEVTVYKDKVELANVHHDGTNYYTFYPINLLDMRKAELLSTIDGDDYKYEYGRNPKYENKDTLINFIEEYVL